MTYHSTFTRKIDKETANFKIVDLRVIKSLEQCLDTQVS